MHRSKKWHSYSITLGVILTIAAAHRYRSQNSGIAFAC
jgi:hypothetical protein